MHILWILGASSFLFALILTPLIRNLLQSRGMLDRPDQTRKLHATPSPNMGGIPLLIAYVTSFAVILGLDQQYVGAVNLSLALKLIPAAAIIFVIGLLDDRYALRPSLKLIAQIAAGIAAFLGGVRVTGIADHHLPNWASLIVTVGWLVICTNAFNLIDGMDGLAAGVGLFAAATTLIAALLQQNFMLAVATAPLVGALLGFLPYNFNPATIFLGDSGSLLVGFFLGCLGAVWGEKSATLLGMTAPIMALAIPILDVCLSIVRRFLRRQPIMRGDRGHIHHRLLALGFTDRRAVLLLYGVCALGAMFSILQSAAPHRYAGIVIVVFCIVMWLGIEQLGYLEFHLARQMVVRPGFRDSLNAELMLRTFEQSFAAATTEERGPLLGEICKELGFAEVRWKNRGLVCYEARFQQVSDAAWTLHISVESDVSVDLVRDRDARPLGVSIDVLVGSFGKTISAGHPAAVRPSVVGTRVRSIATGA